MRNQVPAILCGCATLLLSLQAGAAQPSVVFGSDGLPRTTISVTDLDLGQPSDVRTLYERVQSAAAAVCRSAVQAERHARHRMPVDWRQRCLDTAIEEAVRSAGHLGLTALHRGATETLAER